MASYRKKIKIMKPYSVNCGYTPLSLIRGKRAPRHAYRPPPPKKNNRTDTWIVGGA